MTQVDFYILPSESDRERQQFACRLTEKAFKLGHKVYIHSRDAEQAAAMDKLLWSFRNSSFVPHALQHDASDEPVIIGFEQPPTTFSEVMINLSHDVPGFFSRFERVTEVVVTDPLITEATRENYRFYRDRGYPLKNHDMRKSR